MGHAAKRRIGDLSERRRGSRLGDRRNVCGDVYAKHQELLSICQASYEVEILSPQLQAQNSYSKYVNANTNSFQPPEGWPEKSEVEKPGTPYFHGGKMDEYWKRAQSFHAAGLALTNSFHDGHTVDVPPGLANRASARPGAQGSGDVGFGVGHAVLLRSLNGRAHHHDSRLAPGR